MIILAAAIILSLSNSGIISKANKAKTDSDNANLKEYVNTLRAEWELMTSDEQTAEGSFEAYANKKLEKSGYKAMLSDDGVLMNQNATAAVKEGLKVGDVVTGYNVDVTTYTTDGSENNSSGTNTAQPVTTNEDITWKYLGVNADGELEIMADYEVYNDTTKVYDKVVAAANTKVTLGGKGGYLKGPGMLNTICEKLYSKDGVGTARSMTIDDVNNILGYTGPKGTYYDTVFNEITTSTPLTIGEIGSKLGTTLSQKTTPDGKDIATYYSDYYDISKTSKNIKNTANKDLVYNAKNTYWLASPCVLTYFGSSDAYFDIRCVYSTSVNADGMFNSSDVSYNVTYAVRPVVSLKSNVQLKQNTEKTAWEIK